MVFSGASELRPRCPKIMRPSPHTHPPLSEVTDDMAGMLPESHTRASWKVG